MAVLSVLSGLIIIPVGAMGPFYLRITLSRLLRDLRTMSNIECLAHAPPLPRFIVVVSSSNTLLVISTLDISGDFISLEGLNGSLDDEKQIIYDQKVLSLCLAKLLPYKHTTCIPR